MPLALPLALLTFNVGVEPAVSPHSITANPAAMTASSQRKGSRSTHALKRIGNTNAMLAADQTMDGGHRRLARNIAATAIK